MAARLTSLSFAGCHDNSTDEVDMGFADRMAGGEGGTGKYESLNVNRISQVIQIYEKYIQLIR